MVRLSLEDSLKMERNMDRVLKLMALYLKVGSGNKE